MFFEKYLQSSTYLVSLELKFTI